MFWWVRQHKVILWVQELRHFHLQAGLACGQTWTTVSAWSAHSLQALQSPQDTAQPTASARPSPSTSTPEQDLMLGLIGAQPHLEEPQPLSWHLPKMLASSSYDRRVSKHLGVQKKRTVATSHSPGSQLSSWHLTWANKPSWELIYIHLGTEPC